MDKFINRQHAGTVLATLLKHHANKPDGLVLALPRGGVPVAYEIAKALSLPLDVMIVRKLGVPGHEELAMGAIASGDAVVLNQELINQLNISNTAIEQITQAEKQELLRREALYRANSTPPIIQGKNIILVDDGIATGATMQATIMALRQQNPASITIAVPVAALETYNEIAKRVDEIVCPLKPINFTAVGLWYEDFSQTSDREVCELLERET